MRKIMVTRVISLVAFLLCQEICDLRRPSPTQNTLNSFRYIGFLIYSYLAFEKVFVRIEETTSIKGLFRKEKNLCMPWIM
jgi:hypothetical protein